MTWVVRVLDDVLGFDYAPLSLQFLEHGELVSAGRTSRCRLVFSRAVQFPYQAQCCVLPVTHVYGVCSAVGNKNMNSVCPREPFKVAYLIGIIHWRMPWPHE